MKPFTPAEQRCGTLQPQRSRHTAWTRQGTGEGGRCHLGTPPVALLLGCGLWARRPWQWTWHWGLLPAASTPHQWMLGVGRGSLFSGRKREPRGARGFVTGDWSLFTRPRGGPASPAAAFSLLAGFCPGRDKGGCGRISFPGWRAALPAAAAAPQAPAKGSRSLLHVYLGRNSAGQDDRTVSSVYFPGQGVPVPSGRQAGPRGQGRQWRGSPRVDAISGLCRGSLVPMG